MAKELRKLDREQLAEQKNYISIILDSSGSMQAVREDVISSFNEQIQHIKKQSGDMQDFVSLTTFDSFVNAPIFLNQPPSALYELTREDFVPSGMTALYDAIGRTVRDLKKLPDANDPKVSFLVIIVTDGHENNSVHETQGAIAQLIKECEETKRWTFTYLAANQDAVLAGNSINISAGNTRGFATTTEGINNVTYSNTSGLTGYYDSRRSGGQSVSNFYNQTDAEGSSSDEAPTQT